MAAKTGVVYIQRDRFQVYSPSLSSVVEFRYVSEMIRDLDVLNKALLEEVVKVFIIHSKIPRSNLIFFLADNVSFLKDIVMPEVVPARPEEQTEKEKQEIAQARKEELEKQIKQYLEAVPFEEVATRRFDLKNGVRVYTTNKDLFMAIKDAFEKEGFTVDTVIPGFLLGNDISAQAVLTPAIGEFVLQHANTLRQNNLLVPQVIRKETGEEPVVSEGYEIKEEKATKAPDKKRLPLLIGVFVFLIIVLVVVFLTVK